MKLFDLEGRVGIKAGIHTMTTERRQTVSEKLFPKEKCLALAKEAQLRIRELGGDSRIVRSEEGYVNWTLLFCQSLLGERLKDPPVRVISSVLTPKEQELLELMRRGEKVNLLVVADFDGVLVSPAVNWQRSGRIDLITKLGLGEMIQASDKVIFRTSRWFVSNEMTEERWPARLIMGSFVDQLTRFPFFDDVSLTSLGKMAPEKIEVLHKPLLGGDKNFKEVIVEIMRSEKLERTMIYCLISSEKDRREAEDLLREFPTVASSLVVFDTAHYFL